MEDRPTNTEERMKRKQKTEKDREKCKKQEV